MLWILVQSDTVNELIFFVGRTDLSLWSSDFAFYPWLYIIYKHLTLGTCSVSHCKSPHIFVTYISCPSDFALYLLPNQTEMHLTLDNYSV